MASTDNRQEVYVSIVVETEGPIPGPYSMRGLGAVALDKEGVEIGTFETFIDRLPKAKVHPDNAKYWANPNNVSLYDKMDKESRAPIDAVSNFVVWARGLPGKPILAAYNSAHTWMWVHWYTTTYTTKNPFTLTPLDLKTLASIYVDRSFLSVSKADFPQDWRLDSGKSRCVKARQKSKPTSSDH